MDCKIVTILLLLLTIVLGFPYTPTPKYSFEEVNAMFADGIETEDAHYMRLLHFDGKYLLVGARNALYNISAETMEVEHRFEWLANEEHKKWCSKDLILYNYDCESYVRLAFKRNDTHYDICASSAKTPACRPYTLNESKWVLGDRIIYDDSRFAFAPPFPEDNIVMYKTREGLVFSALKAGFPSAASLSPLCIKHKTVLPDGTTLPDLSTPPMKNVFIMNDDTAKVPAEFVHAFETDSHFYVTFTESAIEMHTIQKTVYSRVARVCKNDRGRGVQDRDRQFELLTFFKTRMLCGIPESVDGSYSYYFNELVSATEPQISAMGGNGDKIMYAVFNNPKNSQKGSALCAYKLSDIVNTFDNSPQLVHEGSHDSYSWKSRPLTGNSPARCPTHPENLTSEEWEQSEHPLLKDPIQPIDRQALFIKSNLDYRMTQLQVDFNVRDVAGKLHDVIFMSTDNGRLLKLIKYKEDGDKEEMYHIVEQRTVFPRNEPIVEMKLITDDGGKKHLILNTFTEVKRVAVEKCHHYESCDECIRLQDPYCSWSPRFSKCVSTSHEATDKFQNLTHGVDDRCSVTSSSTPKPEPRSVHYIIATKAPSTDDKPEKPTKEPVQFVKTNAIVSNNGKPANDNSTTLIVLAVLLPVVFLAVGFIGGILYVRRRNRSKTPNLDKLTNKKIVEEGGKDDIDSPYTQLPKTNNLQYKNNFPTKPNNGSIDLITNGESTLQRTLKSYV